MADGATLYLVGKILGHRQTRSTEVYAHLRDDMVRSATERTGARIAAAMKGEKDGGSVVKLRQQN
jgi:ABC-type molybdate transport system permease subunit